MTATKTPEAGSMAHASFAEALAAFQAEAPTFTKSKTAKVKTKTGGEYTYTYADLSDILPVVRPMLAKHGLSWSSKPARAEDGELVLRYRLLHVSGEVDADEMPLGVERNCKPQELGSAITYARRYALTAQLNLATEEDDDGGAAQQATRRGKATQNGKPSEPEPQLLPDATVGLLIAAFQSIKPIYGERAQEWFRSQLVASGAAEVPEGDIMKSTLQALTSEQAKLVIDTCSTAVEAKAAAAK